MLEKLAVITSIIAMGSHVAHSISKDWYICTIKSRILCMYMYKNDTGTTQRYAEWKSNIGISEKTEKKELHLHAITWVNLQMLTKRHQTRGIHTHLYIKFKSGKKKIYNVNNKDVSFLWERVLTEGIRRFPECCCCPAVFIRETWVTISVLLCNWTAQQNLC